MKKELLFTLLFITIACNSNSQEIFSGTVEIDEVRISARVSGSIEELQVSQGDQVEEGQLLIKIDPTEYQLALTRAEAALTIAEANLETLAAGTREQQIIAASSAVAASRAAQSQAFSDRERAIDLAAAGAISDQQLQLAETNAAQAQTQYISAQQNYSLAVEGARASELQAAQAAVESASAAREIAQNRLEWANITSPLSGVVTGTNIEAGENITPGVTLLTVADMDTVKAIFYVSQPYLATTDVGAAVTVSTNYSEGTQESAGTITHIADQAEFTPSQVETREGRTSLVYRAEAEIPNSLNIFKAGMPVDVVINRIR